MTVIRSRSVMRHRALALVLFSACIAALPVCAQEAPAARPVADDVQSATTQPAPVGETAKPEVETAPSAQAAETAPAEPVTAAAAEPAATPAADQSASEVAPGAQPSASAEVGEQDAPVGEGETPSAEMSGAETAIETTEPDTTTAAAPPTNAKKPLPHDLSPWGMFQAADIIVKTVMVGLALASFITWTVWLAKSVELAGAKRRLRRAIANINGAENLNDAVAVLAITRGPGAALVRAAAEEILQSGPILDHTSGEGVLARITSRLTRIEAAAARRITMGTGVLATIGATAPFVGLFGTVWGIMNSFIGISETQTTNLAVVAPGIAEALLATALGLVAAIPAVVIYNVFARSTAGYRQLLADAAAGVERLASRDLDFRHIPASPVMFARAAE